MLWGLPLSHTTSLSSFIYHGVIKKCECVEIDLLSFFPIFNLHYVFVSKEIEI
jgi:hypothetical protein